MSHLPDHIKMLGMRIVCSHEATFHMIFRSASKEVRATLPREHTPLAFKYNTQTPTTHSLHQPVHKSDPRCSRCPSIAYNIDFMMGLRPPRLFWSLIERLSTIVLEALQRANQYIVVEAMVSSKCEESRKRLKQERP